MTDKAKARANELLRQIRDYRTRLEAKRAEVDRLIREIREVHGPESRAIKDALDECGKDLIRLMKQNKKTLFDQVDQVDLDEGVLIHGDDDKVRLPRDAASRIEHFGWVEALRYGAPVVDRATVEKWPDERLAAIGAERKRVETFEFEVKEVKS